MTGMVWSVSSDKWKALAAGKKKKKKLANDKITASCQTNLLVPQAFDKKEWTLKNC